MGAVRNKRWWVAGAVVVGLLGLWLATGGRRAALVPGGYFAGEIAGVGSVFLGFVEYDGEVTGSLVRSAVGKADDLDGTWIDADSFHLTSACWTNGGWVTNLVLDLAMRESGRELDGRWKDETGGVLRSFRFKRIADAAVVKSSFSMRMGGVGHRRRFVCPVPQLDGTSVQFQRLILDQVGQMERLFMDGRLKQLVESVRWPSVFNEWDFSAVCQVRRLDSNVCSLALSTYPYMGGNGNWQRYQTINLWSSNGWVTAFQLRDLFRRDSGWELKLRQACARQLRELGASDYRDPDIETVKALPELFTVSDEGVQIYFDPYTAGSGAEGAFVVHLPFVQLAGMLATNGPVMWRGEAKRMTVGGLDWAGAGRCRG